MIRIKCPKCATPLALDDDEAGGVGECTDCGAKFRVPAAKAKASARARRGDDDDEEEDDEDYEEEDDEEDERASSRKRARRRPARDEDDEEDEDEEDEEPDNVSKRNRSTSGSLRGNLIMAGVMLVIILVMGLAGIFLNKIGVFAFFGSVVGGLLCSIMVVRAATKDGGTVAFLCVVISLLIFLNLAGGIYQVFLNSEIGIKFPYVLFFFFGPLFWSSFLAIYVLPHWQDAQRFAMVWLFCVVLASVAYGAACVNKMRIDAHREVIKQRLGGFIQTGAVAPLRIEHRG